MKKSLKSFFKGFSLVELMISLITISLITAAFAPIITKKLSSMGVTVGSFGGNGGGGGSGEINCPSNITCEAGYYLDGTCKCQPCSDENCTYCAHNVCSICNDGFSLLNGKCENLACHESGGLPTEACCKSVNAVFIDKKYTGTTDLCMMKYNAGDEENTYKVGTIDKIYHPKYPKIGVQITQTGTSTCTSSANCCWKGNTSNATNSYPGYSAGNRTVCRQNAATKICNNWAFPGTKQGSWRLLTKAEGTKLAAAIAAESDSDHFLTKYMGSNGLQLCDRTSASKGSNQCPNGDACKGARDSRCHPSHVWVSEKNLAMRIENGIAFVNVNSYDNYAMGVRCVSDNIRKAIPDPAEETYQTNEPRNQGDCDKYKALFIDKKYLNGASRNICMIKYNFADYDAADKGKPRYGTNTASDYSDSNAKVTVVDVSTSCSGDYCCWKGTTSNGSGTYDYDATNRTVCRQKAATNLCANWAPDNATDKRWRLLSSNEAKGLVNYITSETKYSSFLSKFIPNKYTSVEDGLQLCDRTSVSQGSNYCPVGSVCKGARDNLCYPSHVWVSEKNLAMRIEDGIASVNVNSYDNYAMSVRCVTDNIKWED